MLRKIQNQSKLNDIFNLLIVLFFVERFHEKLCVFVGGFYLHKYSNIMHPNYFSFQVVVLNLDEN